jgi:hypothetical protein
MSGEFSTAGIAIRPDSSADKSMAETIRSANHRVSDAIGAGREPDVPHDILAGPVREAPLYSLAIAFLLGVAVARRR